MKKPWTAILLAAILLLSSGCGSSPAGSSQGDASSGGSTAAANAVSADEIDMEFSSRDLDVGYDESAAVKITLSGDTVSLSGSGASYADGVITISQEGTYLISGTLQNGRIVVDVSDSEKVQLVLNGASIFCEDHAALFIRSADKVFVTLAEGSENSLSGGAVYNLSEEDGNVDGVIFSRADLTLNGAGKLTVNAEYKHAVVSKDDLILTGGTYDITAARGGLYGKDCVKIADGTFILNTGTDGIQSSNAEDTGRGFVYIAGGDFHIIAGTDGIQAETVLRIDGGVFQITSGGGSANASISHAGSPNENWGNWGPARPEMGMHASAGSVSESDSTEDTSDSAKGLKAGASLVVRGGAYEIDSSDDSFHCNSTLDIYDGAFSIASGDDGMHADDTLTIHGGTIRIGKSYEGIEGLSVTVTGGDIEVTASDDGINSAGGSDTGMPEGRPGQNGFRSAQNSDCYIKITGGTVKVDASGDGLDSNGSLYVEGGTLLVSGSENSGNGALDYENTAEISGGTVVAAGMSGMAQGFSDSSSQCSIFYSFSSAASAGAAVTLADSQGSPLASFTPPKTYQCVVVSSPNLSVGQTYMLSAGSESESLTLSSTVTSNIQGGMGGGMNGRPGDMGGGPQPGGRGNR